jgi:hypothetical protein
MSKWYNTKLSIDQWWWVRLILLISVNLWMWVVSFSLVEVIIINLVLISTNFCTSVYSIAMGMMVNEHKHQIDKAYKKVFTNNPKNHYNARN